MESRKGECTGEKALEWSGPKMVWSCKHMDTPPQPMRLAGPSQHMAVWSAHNSYASRCGTGCGPHLNTAPLPIQCSCRLQPCAHGHSALHPHSAFPPIPAPQANPT